MKLKLLFIYLILQSFFCFSQQTEEFRAVKDYYNHHRIMLNTEFKKKFDAEKDQFIKSSIKNDFSLFMKKMDSIENTALIGALLKVKNLEDLKKLKLHNNSGSEKLTEQPSAIDKTADYPGGIGELRKQIGNLFYLDGVNSEEKTIKTSVAFVVEKDGSISNVHAQGNNFTLNRQAEIAVYSVPDKFSPAVINGDPVRFSYNLPLTLNME